MWTNLGIKASSIDLKKEVIDVTRISSRRTRPPSWNMNKGEYYSSQAAAKRGPWFDYPSGRDHYLTNKDKA
jgi:hypothetical protein